MLFEIHIAFAALLLLSIVATQRGAELSLTFGGGGEVFTQRRGAEKFLFRMTLLFAVGFVGTAAGLMLT